MLSAQTQWNSDMQSRTIWLWHSLTCSLTHSLTPSVTGSLTGSLKGSHWWSNSDAHWHILSDTLSLTWSLQNACSGNNLSKNDETCRQFQPPICGPHLIINTFSIEIHSFDHRIWEMVLRQLMSDNTSYHCNGFPIAEWSSISFNTNRSLLPSAS